MRFRDAAFLALVLLAFPVAGAEPPATDRVDAYVRGQMREQQIPGLALAIVQDGKVIKSKGYGFANLELEVPVSPQTVFQSGSVGKQFTATLVMMLVEDGQLRLGDPIRKYLRGAPTSWRNIEVHHLLSHTAGISSERFDAVIDHRQDYTEDDLFQEIAALPLDFEPGSQFSYSNPGYVLLGILIHKATGKFYGDLLRERIFEPLGMKTARVISEADIIKNRADGYELADGKLRNQEWVAPLLNTTADGSLYLTLDDMVRWNAALDTGKLLKRSSLEQMWTPVELASGDTEDYGFGWAFSEANGYWVIEHGGAWQGFRSFIGRFVDRRLSVIVLANLDAADVDTIAYEVAAIVDPALREPEDEE